MRVLDLGDADADAVGRLLADLGADVLKIEPPGGHSDRSAAPSVGGVGIGFALHNANKRTATLDPASEQDRARWLELVADSDSLIDSGAACVREGVCLGIGAVVGVRGDPAHLGPEFGG